MSLNSDELARTKRELQANLALTGLSTDQVAADLGFTTERLEDALRSHESGNPVDVWLLRDYLLQAVRDAGKTPVPFTVLTTTGRLRARMWFDLRKAPRHDFTGS